MINQINKNPKDDITTKFIITLSNKYKENKNYKVILKIYCNYRIFFVLNFYEKYYITLVYEKHCRYPFSPYGNKKEQSKY